MILIITEKPLIAKSLNSAIPGPSTRNPDGSTTKGDYTIINAFGHLMTLKMPEDYDPALKEWRMDTLPIFFPGWEQKPTDREAEPGRVSPAERLASIGKLLKQADEVIHAGDPDDEGQYLIDEILDHFNYKGPVKRISTRDTTPSKMAKALQNLDDNEHHRPSGYAAYARSVSDLMVGVNLSRYFTLNNPGVLLTVGRVQTPTLGLVAARDAIREGHKTIYFYTVKATVDVDGKVFDATYMPPKDAPFLEDGRILDLSRAKQQSSKIMGMSPIPCAITKKTATEEPPLPFALTPLMLYCEKHWGYTPKQTVDITQSLRDNYNAITYNRSECRYLTSTQFEEAEEVMSFVTKNINYTPPGMDLSIKSKAFNDTYVEGEDSAVAHLAIIPQAVSVDLSKLTTEERNVYLAICKYYMVQFMPPAKLLKTQFTCEGPDGGKLVATSTSVISPGYRTVFKGDVEDMEESPLGQLDAGDYKAVIQKVFETEGKTNPPPAYTQASLAVDMSRIAKYVDDPEIKQLLLEKDKDDKDENGSIGTASTRASIITELIQKGYLEETGSKLHVTPLGKELCRILPEELVKPNLTARWWVIQQDIRQGTATPETLTDSVLDMIKNMLHTTYPKVDMSKIPDHLKRGSAERPSLGKCPRCGCDVIEGKLGFGCSGYKAGCKFVIWKKSSMPMLKDITFSAADAKKFLAGSLVHKDKLRKKDGGTFSGDLVIEDDPSSQYVNIKLVIGETAKESLGNCPRCGKPVTENQRGFGCTGFRDGCKFIIWKTSRLNMLSKTTFTAADAKAFLAGKPVKKTKLLKKDGSTFSGSLVMKDDPNSQWGPNFELADRGGETK